MERVFLISIEFNIFDETQCSPQVFLKVIEINIDLFIENVEFYRNQKEPLHNRLSLKIDFQN